MLPQTEIAKRLNAICAQVIPFLSQEHQQQVAAAVERAKQVTTSELHAIIGVRMYIKRASVITQVKLTFDVVMNVYSTSFSLSNVFLC